MGRKDPHARRENGFPSGWHFSLLFALVRWQRDAGKFVYREIVAPERIVLVNSFSDENGKLTRHPFSASWPLDMLTTTTLAEETGKTMVMVRWIPLNATEEERKTFDAWRDGMRQDWSGTFD